jgi:hypothetical protein
MKTYITEQQNCSTLQEKLEKYSGKKRIVERMLRERIIVEMREK